VNDAQGFDPFVEQPPHRAANRRRLADPPGPVEHVQATGPEVAQRIGIALDTRCVGVSQVRIPRAPVAGAPPGTVAADRLANLPSLTTIRLS